MNNNQPNPSAHEKLESRPRPSPLAWLLRYGLAVGAVAAAMGLRLALTAWVGPGLPAYITFYPIVMVVALLAGLGPGLVATAASLVVVDYWIVTPYEFGTKNLAEAAGMGLFALMGLFMSVIAELYRRNRRKAAAYDREAALRESQARLAAFAEATFEGIVQSEAGRILDCNEQFAWMMGYSVAELRGMEIPNLIAPDDRDRVMADIREGRESSSEHALLRKDGTRIVVETHGRPLAPGSARRHTAIRDITERKRAEEALRRSEVLLRAITDNSPDPIFLKGRDCRMLLANPATLAALQKHAEEVLGKTDEEFYDDPAIGRLMMANDCRVMETGQTEVMEEVVPSPSGPRTFLSAKTPYRDAAGRVVGVIGVARDITPRKQAEAALRESRERLDLALASSGMATFDWDIVHNKRTWSEGVHRLLGTKPETFTGTAEEFFQTIHPEDRSTVQASLARAVAATDVYETEYRAIWPDGSNHHIAARGKVHHDHTGRPVLMAGVCWDITERKRAQEALRENELRYRTLFNTIDAGFCIIEVIFDEEGKPEDYRFLEINVAFEKQTGLQNAQGKRMRELAPAHEAHWFEIYGEIALTGEARHFVNEARQLNRWYDVYAYRVGAPESRQVAILFNDISEHKRAEEDLRQKETELRGAQRVAHIGNWYWDATTDATTGSDELLRIYGFDPATETMPDFKAQRGRCYPVEDWERVNAAVQRTVQTGVGYELDVRVVRNGATIWVTTRGEALRDAAGAIVGLRGTVQDITARKQAEEALRASNQELTRFNQAMVGRELRMAELKKEINALCAQLGQPPRY